MARPPCCKFVWSLLGGSSLPGVLTHGYLKDTLPLSKSLPQIDVWSFWSLLPKLSHRSNSSTRTTFWNHSQIDAWSLPTAFIPKIGRVWIGASRLRRVTLCAKSWGIQSFQSDLARNFFFSLKAANSRQQWNRRKFVKIVKPLNHLLVDDKLCATHFCWFSFESIPFPSCCFHSVN